jgi:hypothetical protein
MKIEANPAAGVESGSQNQLAGNDRNVKSKRSGKGVRSVGRDWRGSINQDGFAGCLARRTCPGSEREAPQPEQKAESLGTKPDETATQQLDDHGLECHGKLLGREKAKPIFLFRWATRDVGRVAPAANGRGTWAAEFVVAETDERGLVPRRHPNSLC